MRASRYLTWASLAVIIFLLNMPPSASRVVKGFFREITAPFHSITTGASSRFAESFSVLVDPAGRTAEAEKLQAELTALRGRVQRIEAIERQNAMLRQQLGFSSSSGYDLIPCEIIARGEASGWWEAVTINKGQRDGLTNNMAVISCDGLVGKTMAVTKHTCDVLLITDRNCSVAAELAGGGHFGIVSGQGVTITGDSVIDMRCPVDPCRMDYLSGSARIAAGEKIVTSGLSTVFPRGLLIGTVSSASLHKSGLYQVVRLKPAADLGGVRYVFVVKSRAAAGDLAPRSRRNRTGDEG